MDPGAAGVVALFCGHKFHSQCVCDWMQLGKSACPYCRQLHPNHPDHDIAEEGEFSDSASECDEAIFPEDHYLRKASEDPDPVVKKLYDFMTVKRRNCDQADHTVMMKRRAFRRERSKLRNQVMKEMRKKLRAAAKKVRNGAVGKEFSNASRRRLYARKRLIDAKSKILEHYAMNEPGCIFASPYAATRCKIFTRPLE
jgi:hypothetical protein